MTGLRQTVRHLPGSSDSGKVCIRIDVHPCIIADLRLMKSYGTILCRFWSLTAEYRAPTGCSKKGVYHAEKDRRVSDID